MTLGKGLEGEEGRKFKCRQLDCARTDRRSDLAISDAVPQAHGARRVRGVHASRDMRAGGLR